MTPHRWHGSVVDAPDTEPFAVLGDLVLAVRTPRSRDFVSVEVGRASDRSGSPSTNDGVIVSSRPSPWLAEHWDGEVRLLDTVAFVVGGASYRLTLDKLTDSPAGPPWVVCDFSLERA